MADDSAWAAEAPLAPEEVSHRSFPTAFRGFDPVEVRAFLGRVADEIRRLHDEEAELRRLVEESADRPADVEAAALVGAAQSEATELLAAAQAEAEAAVSAARSEADAMLREARERVATLGTAATGEAARVMEEARAEAARIRGSATDEVRTRTEEAESAAVRRIAEAEREAATIRVTARAEADALIEAARQRGREMVGEAQAARERMLADLSRRKRAAQAHLEQMKVSRDRLLETLKVARRSIDEITMRFEAQEGGGAGQERPADRGGVASAGEPSSGAPRPSASTAPARSRGVAIGEAPPPPGRPQSAAPQTQAVQEPPPPQPPGDPEPPPSGQPETRTEERRSSALRILRRNRQAERPPPDAPPRAVGRDSAAEGVRILRGSNPEAPAESPPPAMAAPPGPPPAEDRPPPGSEPDAHPRPAPAAAAGRPVPPPPPRYDDEAVEVVDWVGAERLPEPTIEPALEPVGDAPPPSAPAAEPALQVKLTAEEPTGVDGAEAEPLAPLAREEIRPRIEDLFARLRADRQAEKTSTAPSAPADTPTPNGAREPAGPAASDAARASSPVATADREEHLLQSRDRVTEPLVAQLTRRLKRALQDEQNTTLDRLRTSRGQAQLDGLLPPANEQAEPYRRLALSFLVEAARAGTAASPYGPVPVDVADLAAELGSEVAGGLRARVRQVLASTAGDELDLSTISDRISAVYREWKIQKVERLATHSLLAAHERGRFVAFPEGTRLRWIVDDEAPCPDCDDNALAGGVPRGQSFPTGQVHPPAHLGCRCLLSPTPT